MSQVAGARPVPVPITEPARKGKAEMTAVGPTEGATSAADEALAALGTKRGIETLFRSSYRVNMDLSALADAKANIMISINGLIISILIASLAPGIEKNWWLVLPSSLFLLGCLVSITFAVLAARPRAPRNEFSPSEALSQRKNLLFFGNFSHMREDEYVGVLKEVVMDSTRTYEMMMKDIYGVGSVLQKKYVLLSKSYTVFLVALVVGVLGFIITSSYINFCDPSQPFCPAVTTFSSPAATSGTSAPGLLPQ